MVVLVVEVVRNNHQNQVELALKVKLEDLEQLALTIQVVEVVDMPKLV